MDPIAVRVSGATRVVRGTVVRVDIAECGPLTMEVGTTGPSLGGEGLSPASYLGISVRGGVGRLAADGQGVELECFGDDASQALLEAVRLAARLLERGMAAAAVMNAMEGRR